MSEDPKTFDPGTLLGDLQSPGRQRSTLGMVRRAIRDGHLRPWTVSPDVYANLPGVLAAVAGQAAKKAQQGDTKAMNIFVSAASCLRQFAADNAKLFEMIDEAERLDRGDATLRIGTDARRQERDLSNRLSADPEARKAIALLADKLGPQLAEAERLAAESSIEDLAARVVGGSPPAEPRA